MLGILSQFLLETEGSCMFLKGNLSVNAQCPIITFDFSLRAFLRAHSEAFMGSYCTIETENATITTILQRLF